MPKKLRIAVLRGGDSAEREVSLNSSREVIKALKILGYRYQVYDPKSDLFKLVRDKNKIDVVLPILHGPGGEDGKIQGFLESIGLNYAFSGVIASAIGINKYIQHQLFEINRIQSPKYQLLNSKDDKIRLSLPFVIKPNTQGSSVGVTICRFKNQVTEAINLAFKYDNHVLIEKYIAGREITVGVLGKEKDVKALPIVEIVPEKDFFNYEAKYDGTTDEIVPANIPALLARKAKKLALKVHRLIDCSGVTRVDMIIYSPKSYKLKPNSSIYVLEINTIPGMTRESLIPKAAKA